MRLDTPRSAESIDFEVEASTDRQSSDIDFTVDKVKPTNAQKSSVTSRADKQTTNTTSLSNPNVKDAVESKKTSQTPRQQQPQQQKATAPDPEETSPAMTSSARSASSSTSASAAAESDASSHRSIESAPTSIVSSTTFPTVTATTPSLSASHPHLLASRQASASVAVPYSMRENSLYYNNNNKNNNNSLYSVPRSPRVDAVLRHGGPSTRGRHSISPMAPDAARAPPPEAQGPLRYWKERGVTPVTGRSRSSRRTTPEKHVARSKSKRRHHKEQQDQREKEHDEKLRGKSRRSRHSSEGAGHTPSPRAVSNGRSSHSTSHGRKSSKHAGKVHKPREGESEGAVSSTSPSHQRSSSHHRSSHRSRGKEDAHPHRHRSSDSGSGAKAERDARKQASKDKSGETTSSHAGEIKTKDARLRSRGAVVAPTYEAFDSFNATATPTTSAPTLTVQHLEEQKRMLDQRQLQQQQKQQQGSEWSPRNDYSSVSFQSLHSKATGAEPAGAVQMHGRNATEEAIRAPPPRATSPANRQHYPAGVTLQRPTSVSDSLHRRDDPALGVTSAAASHVGGDPDARFGVNVAVPLLSAHVPRGGRGGAGNVWPAALTVRGDGGRGGVSGGPPGPAAWSKEQHHQQQEQRRGSADAQPSKASSPHRYADWQEEEERQRAQFGSAALAQQQQQREDGGDRGPKRDALVPFTSQSAQKPSSVSQPADALQHPSHRFALPSSSTNNSVRDQPNLRAGPAATQNAVDGARAAATTTSASERAKAGGRFSASPQIAGTSPIMHSYVAQSFSSYLPGHSTVLGGRNTANGLASTTLRSNAKKEMTRGSTVGLEVAVLAEPVEELPSPDLLQRYDAVLKNYDKFQQQRGKDERKKDDTDMSDTDAAGLFSLVVHITLPSDTLTADRTTEKVALYSDEASTQGDRRQQQGPRQPVTVGDVKDEVALRTGIPSSRQCLVYEAMSLQDSLPVHLLLSADDADVDDALLDDVGSQNGEREELTYKPHCLRLLCVPLTAEPVSAWPSPKRRHTLATHTSITRLARGSDGQVLETGEDNGQSVDDLKALLLLSPPRNGVSSAGDATHNLPPPAAHGLPSSISFGPQQQRMMLLNGSAEVAPSAQRGAVPFTLSNPALNKGSSDGDAARHSTHMKNARSGDDAGHRSATPSAEPEASVLQHIDRLRRLYLDDKTPQHYQQQVLSPQPFSYATAPQFSNTVDAAAAAAAPLNASRSPGYAASREYLFQPDYQLNQTGRVEHADPAVHALQQRLLLTQLTAPTTNAPLGTRPSLNNDVGNAYGNYQGGAVVSNASPTAALSDALIAALPAPPARRAPTHANDAVNGGSWLTAGSRNNTSHKAAALAALQPPHQQLVPPSQTALTAQSRFAINAFPGKVPTAGDVSGVARGSQHISVLRHTAPPAAALPQPPLSYSAQGGVDLRDLSEGGDDADSNGGDGGVGASWLASSQGSTYADASAVAGEVEVAMSQAPSTLDY